MNLVGERVVGWAVAKEAAEPLDVQTDRARSARQRARRGENNSGVPPALGRSLAHERHEDGHVLGHERAALSRGEIPELSVAEPAKVVPLRGRDDVVAAFAELSGDLRRVVLVEQKLHARMACSRCQASSSRSAIARTRSRHSSTSS